MSLEGTLDEVPLTEVLRSLHSGGRSGILHVSRDEVTKRVYFRNGAIVFASSDASDERLGERLVRMGALKRSDLELACKVTTTSHLRLGATLVDLGYLRPAELEDRVREQVTDILYSLLPWESGRYRTEIKDDPVDRDLERADLSTRDILLEGARRVLDPGRVRRGIGDLHGAVGFAVDPTTLTTGLALTPAEGFVLSRVDGATTAEEIAVLSPLGEEETLRCIYTLVASGLLEVAGAAPVVSEPRAEEATPEAPKPDLSPEAIRFATEMRAKFAGLADATLYQILDVEPSAKLEAIKSAYFRLAKQLHPDHLAGLKVADSEGIYGDLYLKVKSAYEVLSRETERRRYDFSLEERSSQPARPPNEPEPLAGPKKTFSTEQMARIHFGNGERLLEERRYHDAIEELRAAIRLDPARAEYHRLLGRALAKNPKWRKQAEEHLWKALEINRFDAASYVELGELYEEGGLSTRARKMFEEAAAIDPDNLRALEKLSPEKGGSSTLGRLKGIIDRNKGH